MKLSKSLFSSRISGGVLTNNNIYCAAVSASSTLSGMGSSSGSKRTLVIPKVAFKVKNYDPSRYNHSKYSCTCGYCTMQRSGLTSNSPSTSAPTSGPRMGLDLVAGAREKSTMRDGSDSHSDSPLHHNSSNSHHRPSLTEQLGEADMLLQQMIERNSQLESELWELRVQQAAANASQAADQDPDIAQILENNRKWVTEQSANDPEFFNRIGKRQTPKYLYIGCSDSRVPANEILGLGPGEVFVHRNVGNLVNGTDLNVLSCVEFAVTILNVKHIIVTGHYDCGAVRAATKAQDLGLLENWLRPIRDVYRIHHNAVYSIDNEEMKHRKLVELNVMEQALNLYKLGCVQKRRKEHATEGLPAYPRIHAFVFDPKVGLLNKLPVNFKRTISQYKDVYNLY